MLLTGEVSSYRLMFMVKVPLPHPPLPPRLPLPPLHPLYPLPPLCPLPLFHAKGCL